MNDTNNANEPKVPATSEETVATSAEPTASTAPTAVTSEITVTVSGAKSGTVTVAPGTKLKDALSALDKGFPVENYSYRNGGRAMAADRVLNESVEVAVTEKTSGG